MTAEISLFIFYGIINLVKMSSAENTYIVSEFVYILLRVCVQG